MAKKLSLSQVLGELTEEDYPRQCAYIEQLIRDGEIKPVQKAGTNGKKPPLKLFYWRCEPEKDTSALTEELLYHTHPRISVSFYRRNLEVYEKEREMVRRLSSYLTSHKENLKEPMSLNERSMEIFGEEKYLSGAGRTLLRHCGILEEELGFYETVEPFAYYAHDRHTPQQILILENKDPFFSMRRLLLSGQGTLFGEPISTLIYGAGKRVVSTFKAFSASAEPYMLSEENRLFYFGDLDYEGIEIYEALCATFPDRPVTPFLPGYLAMLEKAAFLDNPLPQTKEGQREVPGEVFFSYFEKETVVRMKEILKERRYLPQEILSGRDF